MIVVSSGGTTYKHPEPVRVGEVWQGFYPSKDGHKPLVAVYNLDQMYVWITQMHPDGKSYSMHLSDFYSFYEKASAICQPPQTD